MRKSRSQSGAINKCSKERPGKSGFLTCEFLTSGETIKGLHSQDA